MSRARLQFLLLILATVAGLLAAESLPLSGAILFFVLLIASRYWADEHKLEAPRIRFEGELAQSDQVFLSQLADILSQLSMHWFLTDQQGNIMKSSLDLDPGADALSESMSEFFVGSTVEFLDYIERTLNSDPDEEETPESHLEVNGSKTRYSLRVVKNYQTGRGWLLWQENASPLVGYSPHMQQFCAGMAHDLNNLLSSIAGAASILDRITKPTRNERETRLLENISLSTKRGVRLASDLISFGQCAEVRSLPEKVSVLQIVRQVVNDLDCMKGERQFTLDVDLPESLGVLAVDSELHQVLLNILINAVDALPEGGRIQVSHEITGDSIDLHIRDNGIGMTKEVISKIFNPFFSTKKQAEVGRFMGGSGLGLANVKMLVERWGGQVTCNSQPGEGTTFILRLLPGVSAPRNSAAILQVQ